MTDVIGAYNVLYAVAKQSFTELVGFDPKDQPQLFIEFLKVIQTQAVLNSLSSIEESLKDINRKHKP